MVNQPLDVLTALQQILERGGLATITVRLPRRFSKAFDDDPTAGLPVHTTKWLQRACSGIRPHMDARGEVLRVKLRDIIVEMQRQHPEVKRFDSRQIGALLRHHGMTLAYKGGLTFVLADAAFNKFAPPRTQVK